MFQGRGLVSSARVRTSSLNLLLAIHILRGGLSDALDISFILLEDGAVMRGPSASSLGLRHGGALSPYCGKGTRGELVNLEQRLFRVRRLYGDSEHRLVLRAADAVGVEDTIRACSAAASG